MASTTFATSRSTVRGARWTPLRASCNFSSVEVDWLYRELIDIGAVPAENVPALWTYAHTEESEMTLTTIVDDLLFSDSAYETPAATDHVIAELERRLGCELKKKRDPAEHAGYKIDYYPESA